MRGNIILTIVRREVRDTLSDWRILLPIALLTFLMPQLMVGASSYVSDFVEDQGLAARLVPFVALLVGFVPASFSLITALEAFVGERERNSLESLLAMPVSEDELYLGKLCSSLLTPLLSSFIAMLVYTYTLYTSDPYLYFEAMTAPRLLQIFGIIGLMALTMVAGSVVISSHISSIRAANLMSSFILLPMALAVQVEAFLIINGRWDVFWMALVAFALIGALLVRTGLATFNREELLGREHAPLLPPFLRRLAGRLTGNSPATRVAQNAGFRFPRFPRLAATVTIAERELRETLTDWKVLLPVFILSCIIPVALVGGADFAVNFTGDVGLIGRLVPFATLLVGFVPASFSLITALESFVGERERNSLEALLSMPVSDNALYLSKLCSSLLVPLFSSFTAMLVLTSTLALVHPDLYIVSMTPFRLFQLLLMIGIITLMMVAGAVVISSHTGSIRAANLMASFVLLPTAVMLQLQALLIIGRRWDMLWIIIAALTVIALALVRTGMAAFNREEILSREHETFNLKTILNMSIMFFREYQPAGVPMTLYRGLPFSPRRFYRTELPALLRELRLPLAVALIAAIGGLVAGGFVGDTYDIYMLDGIADRVGRVEDPSLGLALLIFVNNLRVSLLSNIFSSFSFGLFAFLVPAVAFTQIGFVASTLQERGGSWLLLNNASPLQFLLAYVLPHGIIELPAFILSAALGIRIGAALLSPPAGFTVGQNMLWAIANFWKIWLLVLVPLILAGALIEGLVSPRVIQVLYGA